ncbi:MAG: hypothetical protein LUD72_09460, partial [Bacteroidales bacterium]|nr:hypothetical protein [Bacteroidales bacterium]
MAVTGTIDLISDTTGKRIAKALENYQLDGTPENYKSEMRRFFINNGADGSNPEKLTALVDEWYTLTRDDWCGWVEFYQPDVSAVSDGTKGGDNAGLTCEPSTDTVKGQDDYAGLPLLGCVDCNWEVDADTGRPV